MNKARISNILASATLKNSAACFVVVSFILYVLFLGLIEDYMHGIGNTLHYDPLTDASTPQELDYARYNMLRTLNEHELAFDHPNSRVIIIGDIHGMWGPFRKLLKKLHYDPASDLLIHVGDIVSKGPVSGSLDVLSYMTMHNISGVRGNHDQTVINWRTWIEYVITHPGGKSFLDELDKKDKKELKAFTKSMGNKVIDKMTPKWKHIPKGWDISTDHYRIARSLSDDQYTYLLSLPIVLHAPPLHTFFVHAGLLPIDPNHDATSARQPLAHLPSQDLASPTNSKAHNVADLSMNVTRLRWAQELAILKDIPQNTKPWNLLNVRSILKDNSISRNAKEGKAWTKLWNGIVNHCKGFQSNDDDILDADASRADSDGNYDTEIEGALNCYPLTVVYGHAASRGLDIKRWSKGLDSGCVFGRRLSALVLAPPHATRIDVVDDENPDDGDAEDFSISRSREMLFGDANPRIATARIVSVGCD